MKLRRRHVSPRPVRLWSSAQVIPSGMHGDESLYDVESATFIPSGMHGRTKAVLVTQEQIAAEIVEGMVRRGIPRVRAVDLVSRATGRHLGRRRVKLSGSQRRSGLGDASDSLAAIQADARNVQDAHRRLIDSMAAWEERSPGWITNDDDLRRTFADQLTGLKNQFVARSLPVLGVEFPYQIERTDPSGAVVLAVRDDIQATADLLDERKAQQLLGKQISDLSRIPLPSVSPSFNIDIPEIPWYVWAGATGVGLLALKSMLR